MNCPGCGRVYWKSGWALVMKLSKNNFCYSSGWWRNRRPLHAHLMYNQNRPRARHYDAKSVAFYKLRYANAIKLQTQRIGFSSAPVVAFRGVGSPQALMTTNRIKLVRHPDWAQWQRAFGNSRDRAPAFFRAGEFQLSPRPICRTGLNSGNKRRPSGCGKPCMFCMQAGDGSGCPTRGAANDVNSGVGNNRHYCGGGDAGDCSSSGNWAGDSQVLVWARLARGRRGRGAPAPPPGLFNHRGNDKNCPGCGRVYWKSGWALVMKLSKNNFCYR